MCASAVCPMANLPGEMGCSACLVKTARRYSQDVNFQGAKIFHDQQVAGAPLYFDIYGSSRSLYKNREEAGDGYRQRRDGQSSPHPLPTQTRLQIQSWAASVPLNQAFQPSFQGRLLPRHPDLSTRIWNLLRAPKRCSPETSTCTQTGKKLVGGVLRGRTRNPCGAQRHCSHVDFEGHLYFPEPGAPSPRLVA